MRDVNLGSTHESKDQPENAVVRAPINSSNTSYIISQTLHRAPDCDADGTKTPLLALEAWYLVPYSNTCFNLTYGP